MNTWIVAIQFLVLVTSKLRKLYPTQIYVQCLHTTKTYYYPPS